MAETEKILNRYIEKGRWNSDVDLAIAAANQNSKAQHDLVTMLYDRVFATATFLRIRDWDPEDLTQTALIEILKSCGGYKGESSISKWADTIVIRTAFQHLRKKKRRARLWESRLEEFDNDEPLLPDRIIDDQDFWKNFLEIINDISEERRTVFVLHHIYEYTISEISEMTSVLPNTVKDRLKYARKHLRRKIETDHYFKEWLKRGMP